MRTQCSWPGFFPNVFSPWLVACEDMDTPDRFFLQPVIRGLDHCANRRDLTHSSQDKGLWSGYSKIHRRVGLEWGPADSWLRTIFLNLKGGLFVGRDRAVTKENMKVAKSTPLSTATSSASCGTDVIPDVSSQRVCDGSNCD